jgi:Winged helix DNA-binding domain
VQRLVDHRDGEANGHLRRLVRKARHHYAVRRRRDEIFGGLSGEPAWDMLLELFIHSVEGRKVPVKNLCLASCAPTSTAMRWIDRLVEIGLIDKSADDADARRSLVSLTERGWTGVVTLLQAG